MKSIPKRQISDSLLIVDISLSNENVFVYTKSNINSKSYILWDLSRNSWLKHAKIHLNVDIYKYFLGEYLYNQLKEAKILLNYLEEIELHYFKRDMTFNEMIRKRSKMLLRLEGTPRTLLLYRLFPMAVSKYGSIFWRNKLKKIKHG